MTDWHERALYCLRNNGICFNTHASVAAAETSQAKPSEDKPSPPRTSVVYRVLQRPDALYRCLCARGYVAPSVVELFCVWEGPLSPVLCILCTLRADAADLNAVINTFRERRVVCECGERFFVWGVCDVIWEDHVTRQN
jgi:hypothetical protein